MGIEQIRELKRQAGVPKTPKKYSIPKKSKKKLQEEKEDRAFRRSRGSRISR